MEFVLGVHSGINASAAVCELSGHQRLYALQEERLTGEKNYTGFPTKAISECLQKVHELGGSIALAAHASQVVQTKHLRRGFLSSLMATFPERHFDPHTNELRAQLLTRERQSAPRVLTAELYELGLTVPVLVLDHHESHAATAAFGLNAGSQDGSMVVTCDGSGDGLSSTVWLMQDGALTKVGETPDAASIGLLYMWTTFDYGFRPQEDEYKLMGMAPYVSLKDARPVANLFRDYVGITTDGLGFEAPHGDVQRAWPLIRNRLGRARFDHVFAGLQMFTEEILVDWLVQLVNQFRPRRVLGSGGVFMNVKVNQAIQQALPVPFHAFPSCGDESLSLGAAYLGARCLGVQTAPIRHLFLDPRGCENALDVTPTRPVVNGVDALEKVSSMLARGALIGRCAGHMEFGARALGNRSLLCHPGDSAASDRLNRAVKQRDFWMPFAPAVAEEHADALLEQNGISPRDRWMTTAFQTTQVGRSALAACVQPADGTARAQIVDRRENGDFHDLLLHCERAYGVAAVLNTSMNAHGHPLVRTSNQAISFMRHHKLDGLLLGNALIC